MSDIEVEQHNRETKEKSTTVLNKDTERINRARDPQHSSKRRDRSLESHNQDTREQPSQEQIHNADVDEHIRPKKSFITKVKEKYTQLRNTVRGLEIVPHKDNTHQKTASGKPKKPKKGKRGKGAKGARSSNLFGSHDYIPQEVRGYSAPEPFEMGSHVRGGMSYEPPEIHMSPPDMGFKKPKKWRP